MNRIPIQPMSFETLECGGGYRSPLGQHRARTSLASSVEGAMSGSGLPGRERRRLDRSLARPDNLALRALRTQPRRSSP